MMKNLNKKLLELISKISSVKEISEIENKFISEINSIFPEQEFEWRKCNKDCSNNRFNIITEHRCYGYLYSDKELALDDSTKLSETLSIIARIIENIHLYSHHKSCIDEKINLSRTKVKSKELATEVLFENTGTATIIIEEDKTISLANSAAALLSGYSIAEIEGKKKWTDFVHPDEIEKLSTFHQNRRKLIHNIDSDYEFRLIDKSGNTKHILIHVQLIPGTNRSIASLIEISQRIESEKRLFESEQKYKKIYDGLPIGLAQIGLDFRIQAANRNYCDMLGYSESELIGIHIKDFTAPESLKKNLDLQNQLAEGKIERFTMDKAFIHKSGSIIRGVLSANLIKDNNGNPSYFLGSVLDVSERIQIETKLAESEEKFRTIFEDAADGIIYFDKYLKIISVNNAFCELVNIEKENLIGNSIYFLANKFLKIKHGPAFLKLISHAVSGQRITKQEFPLNSRILEISTNKRISDESIIGIIRDITERRNAENKLKISEDNFRTLFNTIENFVFILDEKGIIIEVNKVVLERLGYSREEITGQQVLILHLKKHREEAAKIFQNILDGKEKTCLLPLCTRNNELINVETTAIKGFWDGKPAIIGLSKDISELKESESKFSQAFHKNPAIAGLSDLETGEYIEVNKTFYDKLGFEESEVIGKKAAELVKMDFSFRERALKNLNKNGSISGEEAVIYTKTGKKLTVLIDAAIIQLGNKNYNYTSAIDITEIKNTKQQLRQQNDEYKKINEELNNSLEKIRTINKELDDARKQAEESDKLKSAFLANMSHEIRTPMNGIIGFTDLLKDTGTSKEDYIKYIEIIEKSGKRMLNIINDLIDISKVESGQMKVVNTSVNISKMVEYIYTFFKPEAQNKNLKFEYCLCSELNDKTIITDKEKFSAILINLIKNAIKYTDSGYIKFGFSIINRNKKDLIEFVIEDSGIGIPKNRQKAIFDRFVQSDIHDSEAREGAGLGLSIVKAFLQLLGGEISVESEVAKGSKFTFTLPYTQEESDINQHVEKDIQNTEKFRKLKILVAEDDPYSFIYLKAATKDYCSNIFQAKTGLEAVELCKKYPDIDLIFMDIKLPIMNGYEAVQKIREFNPTVKIIAQTAFALIGDREKAINAGCNEYIAKPLKKRDILSLINKLFNKRIVEDINYTLN